MAYFGESLKDITIQWFIDQEMSRCHVWDDMAQYFVQQFQYNINIMTVHATLANMREKTTKGFCEYAIR